MMRAIRPPRGPREVQYFRVVGYCVRCNDVIVQVASGAKECGCGGLHILDRGLPRANVEKPKAKHLRRSGPSPLYPDWMKEICLEIYRQGIGSTGVQALTGVGSTTVMKWAKEQGIARTHAEAVKRWQGRTHG